MASRTVTFQLDSPLSRPSNRNIRSLNRDYPSSSSFSSSPSSRSPMAASAPRPITPSPSISRRQSPMKSRSPDEQEWRKHGKLYRAHIVLEDEQKGGNAFVLSNQCSIDRYYRVAEKVLDQFLATSSASSSPEEVSEVYLVGNRLVKFLSVVLPTHHQYFSKDPELERCRIQSQEQLVDLLQYMEELALIVDELQYNMYILQDLTPKSLSGDWTESTANETSLGSSGAGSEPAGLEQRVAAVLSASDQKSSCRSTYQSSKPRDISFEEDFFDETDTFHDDFDIKTADFSFQPSFSEFDTLARKKDEWFSSLSSNNNQDWFSNDGFHSGGVDDGFFEPVNAQKIQPTRIPERKERLAATSRPAQTTAHRIPNLKPPRSAPPRNLWQQPQFPVAFDDNPAIKSPLAFKRGNSLLDHETMPAPKSKIEERWERSQKIQEEMDYLESLDRKQPSSDALTTMNANKRLLQHFKGCVRCLIE